MFQNTVYDFETVEMKKTKIAFGKIGVSLNSNKSEEDSTSSSSAVGSFGTFGKIVNEKDLEEKKTDENEEEEKNKRG